MSKSKPTAEIAVPNRLFELGAELQLVYDQIDESGEITAEQMAVIESLELAEQSKAGKILSLIERLNSEADIASQWARYFSDKASARAVSVTRIKKFVHDYMTLNDRKELQTDRGLRFTVQKNGGKVPVTVQGRPTSEFTVEGGWGEYTITNQNGDTHHVPDKYVKVKIIRDLDFDAIRKDIDSGSAPKLFNYGEPGTHIRVR
jgi:hypothetical protein